MESYEDRRDANRMNYWPDFYFKFTALVIFASTLKIKAEQLAVKFISYNGRPIRHPPSSKRRFFVCKMLN